MKKNPLLNPSFLKELYNNRVRNLYVKIISHNLNGEPLESLEGMVTGGSVNLDGTSPVRRSCSLTFCAKQNQIIHDYYWAVTTQFKMMIGIENLIDTENYPEIIWFPFGWYLIASFSYSINPTSYTINISGKDKMCMLNGELGGLFTSQTFDVGKVDEEQEDGSIITTDLTIKEIISNLVHTYGREPMHNIIIRDLDISGSELIKYDGTSPLYLIINKETKLCEQYTTDESLKIALTSNELITTLGSKGMVYDLVNQLDEIKADPSIFYLVQDNQLNKFAQYYAMKVENGETVGYTPTELTFAGQFIMNSGDSVTTALDKIKNMLGYYEYFYNTDGQFVFQKKRTSLATNLTNLRSDTDGVSYFEPPTLHEQYTYNFDGNELITQLSNTMQIANLKNDYTVWGANATGTPIHMRYAIDKKPLFYKNHKGDEFATDVELYSADWTEDPTSEHRIVSIYNWREILYQMAKDDVYRTKREKGQLMVPDFRERLIRNNPQFYTGYTHYEQYYQDIEGFWRTLYHPEPPKQYFERAYSDVTPNKQVYNYEYIDLEERTQKDMDWSITYCYDHEKKELQKWIDLQNILDANPFVDNSGNNLFTLSDADLNITASHLKVPTGSISWDERDATNKLDFFLNCLHYPKKVGYEPIINSIDYVKEQIYIKTSNPEYNPDNPDNGQPMYIYTILFDSLTKEMKDKVYVSVENIASTVKKYEDYFSVETYQGEQINFVDEYAYYFNPTLGEYLPIREALLSFKNDDAIIWSSSSGMLMNDDTAQLLLAAQKDHFKKLYIIADDGQKIEAADFGGLYIKGRRSVDKPYWWYKNTKDSEPVHLVDKVLTDFYVKDGTTDLFCKYTDIYLQRELIVKNNQTTDVYVQPLDILDLNKDEMTVRLDTYNDKNELLTSDFVALTSYLNLDYIKQHNSYLLFEKLDEKIDIVEKAKEEYALPVDEHTIIKPFELIYFNYELAPHELEHDCNIGIQKYMTKTKKDIRGQDHPLYTNELIRNLLLYWELYYEYELPKEPQQYQNTNTYYIDRSACWQVEVYKDFNKGLFWIDFFDTTGSLSNNGVNKIGIRQKVETNQTATALSFGDVPNIQWVDAMPSNSERNSAYTYVLITDAVRKLITQSPQGRSCKDVIDEWVNKYAMVNNTLSFSCIPIYHLEPNTEVFLNNKDLNIYGAYEINRITVPLAYNGSMQLTVTKIINDIV